MSLLKKDSVFAHVNFRLDSGTLQLLGDKQPSTTSATSATSTPSPTSPTSPSCQTTSSSSSSSSVFLKLDFWNVCVELESRPRTASALYSLSLGSVLLQVCSTDRLFFCSLIPLFVCSICSAFALYSLSLGSGLLQVRLIFFSSVRLFFCLFN